MPPLGPVSVATCVRDYTDFDVEVIDENNYKGELDHSAIQAERPAEFVGFYGGLTSTVPRHRPAGAHDRNRQRRSHGECRW